MRIKNSGIVVEFKGGLGNQMFQYSFYTKLKTMKKNVRCVVRRNPMEGVPFKLDLFPNIQYDEIEYEDFEQRRKQLNDRPFLCKLFNMFVPVTDKYLIENESKEYDKKLFIWNNCIITGYFQSLRYLEGIEENIKKSFVFPEGENALADIVGQIREKEYVSIHIRRGNYLLYPSLYGGICEKKYYDMAIDFFLAHNITNFIFFSDDMDWVKKTFPLEGALFFEPDYFNDYHDWYDMYVMSQCSHNIIANSTFSWWGAWLNSNKGKMVVAPKKWINTIRNKDFCPKEWVRIDSE